MDLSNKTERSPGVVVASLLLYAAMILGPLYLAIQPEHGDFNLDSCEAEGINSNVSAWFFGREYWIARLHFFEREIIEEENRYPNRLEREKRMDAQTQKTNESTRARMNALCQSKPRLDSLCTETPAERLRRQADELESRETTLYLNEMIRRSSEQKARQMRVCIAVIRKRLSV